MARVLLVDDEPNIRLFYTDVLADKGYEVIEAGSGDEALALIEDQPMDLVVLDIKLGSRSGIEILRRIARENPDLPVILLSSYVSFQDDYTTWLANSYVLKSSDPNEFLHEVEGALNQSVGRMDN